MKRLSSPFQPSTVPRSLPAPVSAHSVPLSLVHLARGAAATGGSREEWNPWNDDPRRLWSLRSAVPSGGARTRTNTDRGFTLRILHSLRCPFPSPFVLPSLRLFPSGTVKRIRMKNPVGVGSLLYQPSLRIPGRSNMSSSSSFTSGALGLGYHVPWFSGSVLLLSFLAGLLPSVGSRSVSVSLRHPAHLPPVGDRAPPAGMVMSEGRKP